MTDTPMTPDAALARLRQYGERTSTWSTATYNDGTERALHQIAVSLAGEVEQLRARLDKLQAAADTARAMHRKHPDSEHCQYDDFEWPCSTVVALGEKPTP
ncbi:hypothetical protein ACIPVA_03825 [Streptomyces anulatus]